MQYPSWSFSSHSTFAACKRQYFYDKYYEVCDNKYHVLCLKKMTSLPMLSGSIVHSIIASAIAERYTNEIQPDTEAMKKSFRDIFGSAVEKSLAAADKSEYAYTADSMLEEHYYNDPDIKSKIKNTADKCADGIACLCSCKLWHVLMNSLTAQNIRHVEKEGDFPYFTFEGIRIYAIIDLAVYGESWFRIFDWKTGRPGEADPVQLAVYGMYAQNKWNWRPEQIRFEFVHMTPFIERVKAQITAESIADTAELIRCSFDEMLRLYNDGNPHIESFPKTESAKCRFCRYRELCSKEI